MTYLVRTVCKTINRSFRNEKNKFWPQLRFSNAPQILANKMVNEVFESIYIYKNFIFVGYSHFGFLYW